MRRITSCIFSFMTMLAFATASADAQQTDAPQLKTLAVPASEARSLATKLSLQYRDVPGVQISPDAPNERLVVMAPAKTQQKIAADLKGLLANPVHQASARSSGPQSFTLANITWREFEDDLQRFAGQPMPITTSRNGERAAFQMTTKPMQGTTVEVDRRNNTVTVIAPQPAQPGWKKMIAALDQRPTRPGTVTEMMRLENSEPAPIQRALRLLKSLDAGAGEGHGAAAVGDGGEFRNAIFQQGAEPNAAAAQELQQGDGNAGDGEVGEEGGAGVIGDTQIQFLPELGQIIIRGSKRDVQRVMDVIKEIEEQSKLTAPAIEVRHLEYADCNAVAALLAQLYEDVLSARQGEVSITALDVPNALLLIGREEALRGLLDLIAKIDQPVDPNSRLRVFRLQNASAVDAEQTIRDFFTDRPGSADDVRPGLGPRVRVLADYRTNSLIVSAAPRDMVEVTRLVDELDVEEHAARNEIKVFKLNNAIAEELAPVLQTAINGEGEEATDNLTPLSANLSIVAVDADGNKTVDSGILAGALVTADAGANAIVVRAPSSSMPLIAELIRQLDRSPDIDSLVKVFTMQNSDAAQLTTALQTLFGDDAGTLGTSVGAGNLAGLPPSTAGSESSLVPLRFSPDIRTNSIIASGSAEDLEVVESILLRLDSEGFAERITEVIWLRHQAAEAVALAIQDYVAQRTNGVNRIQQYQQGGLGPYDLADRDLIVASHFETNSLLVSVSPRLYEEVRRLIDKLDRRPPMVLIKVLLAEVRLDDAFEIGGEVGLQDALLYDRGIAAGAFPGATEPSDPGFNFNNAGTPNNNSFGQENLAASGLTSFGVGTTNSSLGYGGFVLSAASESVSLLLRVLQDAARLQILSRPLIMTVDNTEGFVQVGRQVARVTGVINNGVAGSQVITQDVEVGLIMRVLPRVGADGLITIDIDATRSEVDANDGTPIPTGVPGEVVVIQDILRTTAQSTIAAYSGQTVVFGGLIQKTRAQFSRRVPYVADIPLLGYFFKYEQEIEGRSELLVIMTPMLVDGDEDLEYVKQVESSRMSWCLADVVEAHGDVGLSGGYGLWGPAVGGTIYPDLQPTLDPRLSPPRVPYRRGAPVTFPSNSQYIPDGVQLAPGEVCLPGEVYDVPGIPIDMIDTGLEYTPVVPAAPNYAPQNVVPPKPQFPPATQQGNVMPRGNPIAPQPSSIPNPVVLPAAINGSVGRVREQHGFTMPGAAPGANVIPVSNAGPVSPADQSPTGQFSAARRSPNPTPPGNATEMGWPAAPPTFSSSTKSAAPVNWMELSADSDAGTDSPRRQPHRLGSGQ